jgi:PAS domain S-box-containing protein
MRTATDSPEELLEVAVAAMKLGEPACLEVLDDIPAPIYVTDDEGRVTYFNPACVPFAGRTPEPGEDRWCVTWKLFTKEGTFLPHDQCPMAVAIKERRPIRNIEAIAERPDGSRIRFRPFPTPLVDGEGNMTGALNMLFEITHPEQLDMLRSQAARCRRLAKAIDDSATRATLSQMAADYEDRARSLRLN